MDVQTASNTWPTPPAEPPKKGLRVSGLKGWALLTGIALAALIVGAATTAGSDPKPKTVTQTRTVTSIVTHTNTVTETPQACLDALDSAETLMGHASDGFTIMGDTMSTVSDAFTAISDGDVAGINAASAKIKSNTSQLTDLGDQVGVERDTFNSQADECRSS